MMHWIKMGLLGTSSGGGPAWTWWVSGLRVGYWGCSPFPRSPHHPQQLATTALYFTYSALEEEMDRNKDHPAFAPLYFPLELHRKEALTKDMEYFFGEDWKEQVQCSAATQKYVERIHYVGQHEPELLVAHAYTRYMGDLSGGQVLKKVAQRALKLPSSGEGTQFYLFENVDNAQQFKQFYRARMNALDLNLKTKEKIVEEANKAFVYNMQVLLGVAGRGPLAARAHPELPEWVLGSTGAATPPRARARDKCQVSVAAPAATWATALLICTPEQALPAPAPFTQAGFSPEDQVYTLH